jgi:hypothetical protein
MSPARSCSCALTLLFAVGFGAESQSLQFESRETQTTLLELFTSEGCNSCPPSEKWLTSLKESPGLWKDFVPVAFHVDYWDRQGWRDPWSSRVFSDRQRAYSASWKGTSVYTPGFVVDGKECRDWPQPRVWPPVAGPRTGILKVGSTDRKTWQVRFAPARREGGACAAHVALLANGLTSDVKAGENRGRRLTHDFAVKTFKEGPLKVGLEDLWGQFLIDGTGKGQTGRLAVAVWITRSGSPRPIQAVGGWLP